MYLGIEYFRTEAILEDADKNKLLCLIKNLYAEYKEDYNKVKLSRTKAIFNDYFLVMRGRCDKENFNRIKGLDFYKLKSLYAQF